MSPSASQIPDPRTHAYRPDLADFSLRNTVIATRYTEPVLRQCVRGLMPLLAAPHGDARQVSQIRYGEFLDVFEIKDGFAWVQNRVDRYVGYMPSEETLSEEIADLSHRVSALQTFVYPEPDIKSPPMDELTLGSYVKLSGEEKAFKKLASGGYVFAKHIGVTTDMVVSDYVFSAGRLLHAPYLWGGRSPKGIDCSGLVQLSLEMAGIEVPRDSDQQREAFGKPLAGHWRDIPWQRGDVVFFLGHVGIMTGSVNLIHASADDMRVIVEPLSHVVARGNEILAAGRP